ncbi:unnamed protein product [Camellia sinensis]
MHWDEQVKIWHVGWNVLVHPCDTHGVCGPSGLCNRDQSPNCECLKGFVPNSTEDSRKGNWAGGCVRNNELLCQKNTTSLASSGKAHNDGGLMDIQKIPFAGNDLYLRLSYSDLVMQRKG